MKTRFQYLLTTVALLLNATGMTFAQGTAFTYHGRLNASVGPANGSYDLTFSVFDAPNVGNRVGSTLTNTPVGVTNGLFITILDFGPVIFTGADRWLEMSVRTNGVGAFTRLSPRQLLAPTPYAIMANSASNLLGTLPAGQLSGTLPSTVLGGHYSGLVMFGNAANSFAGNGADLTGVNAATLGGLGAASFWQLGGNAGTTAGINFLGTTDEQALELKVNGQRAYRLEPTAGAPNVIGGSLDNSVSGGVSGATIAGGSLNRVFTNNISFGGGNADFTTIGGGIGNIASAGNSTIGGGVSNSISIWRDFGYPAACTIGGGSENHVGAGNIGSTIGGGVENWINDLGAEAPPSYASISGGRSNFVAEASAGAAIGGGQYNWADGICMTIAGGTGNRGSYAYYSSIGSGSLNTCKVQYGTIAGGLGNGSGGGFYSTIAGGYSNRNGGTASAIGGGYMNTNTGVCAIIPGGWQNVAASYAFAAGSRAKALHNGSFVWSDDNNFDFPSTDTNSFSVRSVGGVRFVSGIDAAGIPTTGVELVPGEGAWSSLSDRNAKENFADINPREVLERVNRMAITTWNYKSQDAAIRHMGPMAQDFAAAFQVGANDRHITTVDADGVALAAIQGLNQKLEEKEAEIQSLQKRLEILERAVLGRETAQNGGGQ